MKAEPPNILIVDDTPANLQLLSGMLKDRGYRVRPVPSGQEALQAAQRIPPDLILLDINMPGMSGYEVCQRLKEDPKLRDIPVLFISALSETAEKVKAFSVGGVDYVTKPFQIGEVDARVQTHLELRRQKRALQESNERLTELERVRENLTHMIVHDLRSPLTAILLSLDLLDLQMPNLTPAVSELLRAVRVNGALMTGMVTQLLDISRLEAGHMPIRKSECDLAALGQDVLNLLATSAGGRRLTMTTHERVVGFVDADLIRRVISNLLGNALKFTPNSGEIRLSVERRNADVRIEVADNGPGISTEDHQKIFEKFGQSKDGNRKLGTGLGLTFCKLAIEAHGGTIGVESGIGRGSVFWFVLPPPSTLTRK